MGGPETKDNQFKLVELWSCYVLLVEFICWKSEVLKMGFGAGAVQAVSLHVQGPGLPVSGVGQWCDSEVHLGGILGILYWQVTLASSCQPANQLHQLGTGFWG